MFDEKLSAVSCRCLHYWGFTYCGSDRAGEAMQHRTTIKCAVLLVSYRLIDGRKCWYEGKPMLSKSLLHWRPAQTARADDPEQEPILPASQFNFLDAQASLPDDSDSFEARWPRRFFQAVGK